MLRKRHGRVVCLAPASEHGSVDGLAQAMQENLNISPAELEAAASLEEDGAEEEGPEPVQTPDEPEESPADLDASAGQDLQAKLDAALEENKALTAQVSLLERLNSTLNSDKSGMQAKLDVQASELESAAQACEALKPGAVRAVKVLSRVLGEPVADDLSSKSAAEIGSICASLISKNEKVMPNRQVSNEMPTGTGAEPEQVVVPTASESGLSNF